MCTLIELLLFYCKIYRLFFCVVVLLVAVLLCITHPGMASASGITELYGLPSGWHYGLANSIYDNGN